MKRLRDTFELQPSYSRQTDEQSIISESDRGSSVSELAAAEQANIMSAFRPVQQPEPFSRTKSLGVDDSDSDSDSRRDTEMETLGCQRFGTYTPRPITPTVIPQIVRDQTPDSVVSTGTIRIQGAYGTSKDINVTNISGALGYHPERGHTNTRQTPSKKKSFLFWKYSIGFVVSLVVLTAIVSAIYFYRSTAAPTAKGTVIIAIGTEMKGFVCPDVKLSLGRKLRFSCTYQGNEPLPINETTAINATIMDGKSVLVIGNASTVNSTVKQMPILVMTDLNVSCSINGSYTITISGNVTANVNIGLNSKCCSSINLTVSIAQH